MNEPNESDLPNQDGGLPSKSRLSILDLMLMMAAFAMAMGLHQNFQSMQLTLIPQNPFWGAVFHIHYVVFAGLTFWGTMLLVRSRLNATKQSVWHPGHLMLIMVFIGIAAMPTRMLFAWFVGEENVRFSQAKPYIHFITSLLIFLIALAGALTWRWGWSWVASWVLLTLSSLSTLGRCCLFAIRNSISPQEFYNYLAISDLAYDFPSLPVVVFVVIAMMIDLRKGTPRDAAHWIGIVCWFGCSILIPALRSVEAAGIWGR